MLYGDTVQDTRQIFFDSWKKYTQRQPLTPLENQLIEVILQHPEYHAFLDKQDSDAQFTPDMGQTNPFLHMGLHLTIRDQIAMNRPAGMQTIFQQLLALHKNAHDVEHLLLEPLMDCLWMAQKNNAAPDELSYLQACRRLIDSH